MIDHLPHYKDCRGSNWWEEMDAGSNSIPLLKCWGCGKSFMIGSKDELFDLDSRTKYTIQTKKRIVEDFVGYEVEHLA